MLDWRIQFFIDKNLYGEDKKVVSFYQYLATPCDLITNLYVIDCPVQKVTCGLYPWNTDPNISSFGVVLTQTLQDFFVSNGINPNTCPIKLNNSHLVCGC